MYITVCMLRIWSSLMQNIVLEKKYQQSKATASSLENKVFDISVCLVTLIICDISLFIFSEGIKNTCRPSLHD